jgi:hypothetical protein
MFGTQAHQEISMRRVGLVALVAVMAAPLVACNLPTARAGARCPKVGAVARDATHVLRCERQGRTRRWVRKSSIAQLQAWWAAQQKVTVPNWVGTTADGGAVLAAGLTLGPVSYVFSPQPPGMNHPGFRRGSGY